MPTRAPLPPATSFDFYQAAPLIASVWRAGSATLTCRIRGVGCPGYQRPGLCVHLPSQEPRGKSPASWWHSLGGTHVGPHV